MATVHIPRHEPPREPYRFAPEPDVPHFEQLEGRWTWERVVALASLSLLVHALFALVLVAVIVALPKNSPIVLTTRELLRENSIYVDAPPDTQKPALRPDTNVISDKDRIKSTRVPHPDRKTLNELADNLRPGPALPPAAPSVPPSGGAAPQVPAPPAQPYGGTPITAGDANAQLRVPAPAGRGRLPDFRAPATAGSEIQQAARAASGQRGGIVVGGEYGSGPGLSMTPHRDQFEILTDTLGVDFAPYMKRMKITVENNWYNVMPESAFPPWRKRGTVVIEFSILKDGTITGVRMLSSSGDVSLDRAAYAAITSSNILSALPTDFRADYMTIRAAFHYNPDRNAMR
jgi:TonB family protein